MTSTKIGNESHLVFGNITYFNKNDLSKRPSGAIYLQITFNLLSMV